MINENLATYGNTNPVASRNKDFLNTNAIVPNDINARDDDWYSRTIRQLKFLNPDREYVVAVERGNGKGDVYAFNFEVLATDPPVKKRIGFAQWVVDLSMPQNYLAKYTAEKLAKQIEGWNKEGKIDISRDTIHISPVESGWDIGEVD